MFSRSPFKLLKTLAQIRCLTQVSASLRPSKDVFQQVQCDVEGAPYYSLIVSRSVGCALAGRNLGSRTAKVDLVCYGGRHFAYNKFAQSPSLTLTQEAALLIDRSCGAKLPAVLFHGGDSVDGSIITLKGIEGEEMWEYTTQVIDYYSKALRLKDGPKSCEATSDDLQAKCLASSLNEDCHPTSS